jgi:hypothetical protein
MKVMKKVNFGKTEILFVLFACAVFVMWAILQKRTGSMVASAQKESLVVNVQRQPGAPLTFSSLVVESTNPREPKVSYFVTNSSGKAISAYVVRYIVSVDQSKDESSELHYGFSSDSVLQVGRVETGSFEGREFAKTVDSLTLSLDFVEFTDGATWGADIFKSSEQLAGMRAGAEAELAGLKKVRLSDGMTGVQRILPSFEPSVPKDHSSEWIKGFQSGAATTRARLLRARDRGGSSVLDKQMNEEIYKPERRPM